MRQRSGSGSAKSCFDRELDDPAFGEACLAGFCGGDDVVVVGGDVVGAAVCLAAAGVDTPALAVFEAGTVATFWAAGESL